VPNIAADKPSITMLMLKMMAIGVRPTPKRSTSGFLNTLKAYTSPMLKCTMSAAGRICHLLKPGQAVILSLDKNPMMTASLLVSIPRRIRDRGYYVDALQVTTGGCGGQSQPSKLECKE
jgi:hypothetical protein